MPQPPTSTTQADWRTRAAFVAVAILLVATAFTLAKTGRDALFVQQRGLYDLPSAYIGIAVLSFPVAWAVLWLVRAYGARRIRVLLPAATALALPVLAVFVRPGGGPLMVGFFMFVPLLWGVVFSVSWLLAADLLHGAGTVRTAEGFGFIGSGAIVGGVLAGLLARWLAPLVEPQVLLHLSALMLAAAASVMFMAQRRYPARPPRAGRTIAAAAPESRGIFRSDPYARALLTVGVAGSLAGILVEFQFYLAAAIQGGSGREQAAFFANFYLVLNATALAVQLWILPRLQKTLGVSGSLLVLPVALVGGAVGLAVNASVTAASTLRVAEGGLKASIHRASWEQAFLPLGTAVRTGAKLMVDGMAARMAEGAAALLLLGWLHGVVGGRELAGQDARWIPGLLLLSGHAGARRGPEARRRRSPAA